MGHVEDFYLFTKSDPNRVKGCLSQLAAVDWVAYTMEVCFLIVVEAESPMSECSMVRF